MAASSTKRLCGPVVASVVGACVLALIGACSPKPSAAGVEPLPAGQEANAASNVEWKLVTTWPKNLPALGTAPERIAELVDAMSAGRFRIRVYAAGELVPALEVFDAVSQGHAEMGHGAAYYWRGKAPMAAFFTTVPFGMTAQEMNGWLRFGGGMELWRELYEPFGLVPFRAGNSGAQMAGWFNKEIHSLADVRGLKMRIPGLGGEVMDRAGASSVTLPGGEVFTSLQTGVVDAAEWVGPYNDLAFGLQETAKLYYYPGWHEPGATLEAIVGVDAWAALPADFQAMLETACTAVNQEVLDEFTARNAKAMRTLSQEHGVRIRPLPDDVLARLKELSAQVLAEQAAGDALGQRILASYQAFLDEARDYQLRSEQAYVNAREAAG